MLRETLSTLDMVLTADRTVSGTEREQILRICQNPTPKRRRLGTVRQAAGILGVHPRTVQRYGLEGKIKPIYQSRRRVRYDLDEIEQFAATGMLCDAQGGE